MPFWWQRRQAIWIFCLLPLLLFFRARLHTYGLLQRRDRGRGKWQGRAQEYEFKTIDWICEIDPSQWYAPFISQDRARDHRSQLFKEKPADGELVWNLQAKQNQGIVLTLPTAQVTERVETSAHSRTQNQAETILPSTMGNSQVIKEKAQRPTR